ncbi:MAG: single-stranded-DNA-specific exonuclease RecJ [Candidatus Omnitrophica bacterium]|nr:single-stranded-DNA-specific exonuclease RecJ [Candidatus Omnitrophota bacterium]
MTQKTWKIIEPDIELQQVLAKECGISPITAQLLINRGISTPEAAHHFIEADPASLHDPFLLKDMDKAVRRVKEAISKKQKIMIYGDYDVDGISAAALLKNTLDDIGGDAVVYIPHRVDEGYGLNMEAAGAAYKRKVSLIITVDCGISGKKEVEYLSSVGIVTVITDHHKISEESFPSRAYAVINPLQKDCGYPFKYLSGVAVAYKFAQALTADSGYDVTQYLDLVALGTIQDMVPQLGENRVLTKQGLVKLNGTDRPGIRALIERSGLEGRTISYREVGFMLGPRINAAGRVSSAEIALNLLTTDNKEEADELASVLDRENRNRQKIGSSILNEALEMVENEINFKDDKVIVLDSDDWHPGVIGIVASRIAERFNRPTVMISFNENEGKGSGRSVNNFHLFEALTECRDVLKDFGGHAAACGLAIMRENLELFKTRLNKVASGLLAPENLTPTISIDAEVPLHRVNRQLINEIESLSPYGPGNPRPLLSSKALRLKGRPRSLRRDGVKLWLTDDMITHEAIGFRLSYMLDDILESATVDVVYTPSMNMWKGVESVQLELVDVKANLI